MKKSQLAERIAHDISVKIASKDFAPGDHLRAQALADTFGVSRSPIREALLILNEAGLVQKMPNRGFYVSQSADQEKTSVPPALLSEQRSPYHRIANDWRNDVLPEEVTEQFLRETYKATKAQVQEILTRAVREGWAERKAGYGWRFLNVAKSPRAFQQIYQFRMSIEPAAMLLPEYEVSRDKLEELRATQKRMLDHDIEHLPVERLLSNGAQFHEELIKFANNPYFHMALVRVNQMRRLLEYSAASTPERFIEQSTQHLAILDLLARGEILEASFAMKKHLSGAMSSKMQLIRVSDEAGRWTA
ncbi:transcriptional regulator NanR [Roseovarius sp. THAF27]|uniref:GntR family transcriptional regulator n=1 Tax=Roseovarius sp. THAF27 TaxID=2587850 RepID=UPI0012678CAC|nr:GntR family transcriptional regulator [Roseovarius sp. THAF27]QFT81996.1 transcriptional regulator NanR [Roseovarius sp. THAF27]